MRAVYNVDVQALGMTPAVAREVIASLDALLVSACREAAMRRGGDAWVAVSRVDTSRLSTSEAHALAQSASARWSRDHADEQPVGGVR